MPITARIALEIATHEAVIRQMYRDSVGVDTWGFGLTRATGHDVTRYRGKPASIETCVEIYVWALKNYAVGVDRAFASRPLTEAQYGAALSFHWNTGAIERASWVKLWLSGQTDAARVSFLSWNKPTEIQKRRKAEHDLFFDGKWAGDGFTTEYTRVSASLSPVWSSAKRIDIRAPMASAFHQGVPLPPVAQPLDFLPKPDAVPAAFTLSPDGANAMTRFWRALVA